MTHNNVQHKQAASYLSPAVLSPAVLSPAVLSPAIKKNHFNSSALIVLLVSLFFSSNLLAADYHSHKDIQAAAIDYVRSQLPDDVKIQHITAGNIDSRIHFKQCTQELTAKSRSNKNIAKSWTIGVYCYDDKAWNIYITIKTTLLRKMLVSKTTIMRGELISTDNVALIEHEISNKRHFSNISDAIGHEARRTIRPNRIINSSMLQQAFLVHKKESVLIYAQNSKIRVSMKGTALQKGKHNEMIKVRNNSSNKIIEALVIDRGIVVVNF